MPIELTPAVAAIAAQQGYGGGGGFPVSIGKLQGHRGLLGLTSGHLFAALPDFAFASPIHGVLIMEQEAFRPTALLTPIKSPLPGLHFVADELPVPTWRQRELVWRQANAALLQDRYCGNWVALEGDRIVAYGESAAKVAKAARTEGIASPYIFRVTEDQGDDVGLFGV